MTCYLCGASNPTTKDHVPPKGFFPEPRPSNLITLPCCEDCNSSYALDDDAARAWLSIGLGHSPAADWIIENKVFPGTFTRSRAFCASIHSSMIDDVITDEDGQPMDVARYSIDRERTERFVTRVTKGLLRHYFPEYDATQDRWFAHYIGLKLEDLARVKPIKDKLPCFDSRGEGVISYRFGFTSEGTTGIWVLVFYDTAAFLVTHTKSDILYSFMDRQ